MFYTGFSPTKQRLAAWVSPTFLALLFAIVVRPNRFAIWIHWTYVYVSYEVCSHILFHIQHRRDYSTILMPPPTTAAVPLTTRSTIMSWLYSMYVRVCVLSLYLPVNICTSLLGGAELNYKRSIIFLAWYSQRSSMYYGTMVHPQASLKRGGGGGRVVESTYYTTWRWGRVCLYDPVVFVRTTIIHSMISRCCSSRVATPPTPPAAFFWLPGEGEDVCVVLNLLPAEFPWQHGWFRVGWEHEQKHEY